LPLIDFNDNRTELQAKIAQLDNKHTHENNMSQTEPFRWKQVTGHVTTWSETKPVISRVRRGSRDDKQ